MKRIKIQSVSDIITNSSSEVFVKKIDEFGILDEILEAVGVKEDYIYFRTEEDIENWFMSIKDEDIYWDGENYEILEEAGVYADICEERYDETTDEFVKKLSKEEQWEIAKGRLICFLLGNAVSYCDRDEYYRIFVEDPNDTILNIIYKHYKENPATFSFEDRFTDWFGNTVNVDDFVMTTNDLKITGKNKDKYASTYLIAKIKSFDFLQDGSYTVTYDTNDGEFTENFRGTRIDRFIKYIPQEFYGAHFWDKNTKGLNDIITF
jgi:hypothetical protein